MSNLQSAVGGAVWVVVSALMMMGALNPTPSNLSDTQYAAVKIAVGFAEI